MVRRSACPFSFSLVVALLLAGLLSLPGCRYSKDAQKMLSAEWARVKEQLHLQAGASNATDIGTNIAREDAAAGLTSESAKRSKENAELLHEMFVVVMQKEPKDRAEFGNFVDTLNQGASFEGVYNGFTHSAVYRKLETLNATASAAIVRVFVEELELLDAELPARTRFTDTSARPLPPPVTPGLESFENEGNGMQGNGTQTVDFADNVPLAEQYFRIFRHASPFTLKRVLGDEALKVIAAHEADRKTLASWYSKWVTHTISRKVDFGLELRNKPDEQFHYQWALSASEDRLKWEVLNRVHRILNHANAAASK